MIFPCAKHANAKIQIYKYTNAAYYELPETPNMCHILEKRIVQGYQKLYFHVSNMQTPNYKIQNTKYTIHNTKLIIYKQTEQVNWKAMAG